MRNSFKRQRSQRPAIEKIGDRWLERYEREHLDPNREKACIAAYAVVLQMLDYADGGKDRLSPDLPEICEIGALKQYNFALEEEPSDAQP